MKSKIPLNLQIPLALLGLCYISYGLYIPWLGFYWDDWVYSWIGYMLGPGGFQTAFAQDRPFLSMIYMITTSILGYQPIAWQIFALLTKWGVTLLFWWFLKLARGNKQDQHPILLTAAFFAIYPGFGQHHISVIYSQAYVLLGLLFFSFVCMVLAVRSRRYFWHLTILSIISALVCHLSTEYFFGLEFTRPFFLWVIHHKKDPSITRIIAAGKSWIPYLISTILYAAWRFFQTQSADYQGYEFVLLDNSEKISSGVGSVIINTIIPTFDLIAIKAWIQVTQLFTYPLEAASTWINFGIIGVTFLLIVLFGIRHINSNGIPERDMSEDNWSKFLIVVGLISIFLGRLPSWIAGLPLSLEFPFDRFMLSTGFGASLFLSGLVIYFLKSGKRRVLISAMILSLAVAWNASVANTFRRDWNNQKEFFQQLTWRIPAIKENTMLLTHELPLKYYSDNSLTAPVNWIYAPNFVGNRMPYILVYTKIRLGQSLPNLLPDQDIYFDFRAFDFQGSTNDTISFFYPASSCLRVLDPIYGNNETIPELPDWYSELVPISDMNRIISPTDQTLSSPANLLDGGPESDWCYYFLRAELSRQSGDWRGVNTYASAAFELGLKAKSDSEYLVFVEGYAREEHWNESLDLARKVVRSSPELTPGVCSIWNRISHDNIFDPSKYQVMNEIMEDFNCHEQAAKSVGLR